MLAAILVVQIIAVIALVLLLLRRNTPGTAIPDARLESLLNADLASQVVRADARAEALDQHLRLALTDIRRDQTTDVERSREAAANAAASLRTEIVGNIDTLGKTLRDGLGAFRSDNTQAAETLRATVEAQLGSLSQRFVAFSGDVNRHATEDRDALHTRLTQLGESQAKQQEQLRTVVEGRLDKLNENNAAKLEEMRLTVDEKLQATLQDRLTKSFGQVTDQLTKVHAGLGEMSKLSAGVDGLSRIFTNVKSRGGFAEVQLGMLLSQMLAPNQFLQNARVKANTLEAVEYAVKFPTPQGETLLPIDAKFPREAWERLETAYGQGSAADIAAAGKAFENAIRTEGKRICEKYIAPPTTTSFAIMFLPTEGLYAEVMRRDGLQADIQQNCRVTIAGPSTLSAILNSFQMGFHMLQMQQKGDEVWKVLANAKSEFEKFEGLMGSMEKQVGTVQNTIEKLNTRTRVINRTLRDIQLEDGSSSLGDGSTPGLHAVLPLLAAEGKEPN